MPLTVDRLLPAAVPVALPLTTVILPFLSVQFWLNCEPSLGVAKWSVNGETPFGGTTGVAWKLLTMAPWLNRMPTDPEVSVRSNAEATSLPLEISLRESPTVSNSSVPLPLLSVGPTASSVKNPPLLIQREGRKPLPVF